MSGQTTRRLLLATGAGAILGAPLVSRWPADAAEFEYKVANNLPANHPMNIRLADAIARIKEESSGRIEMRAFPNSVLGGDTDMISQLRSGAIEFYTLSGGLLSTMVPVSAIYNTAFVFKDYDEVWSAMDGPVGAYIRGIIEKTNLRPMSKMWNNGFRQITSSAKPIAGPEDLRDFKIRVPVSPVFLSTFKALGASPTSLNFAELYSALQTKIVDGQENALILIDSAKLYEVQKHLSLTNHIWDGFFMLANGRAWARLDAKSQELVGSALDEAALRMREDTVKLDQTLETQLSKQGLKVNPAPADPFREALRKAGFYADWKAKFGAEAWNVLEKAVGQLT